MFEMLCSNIAKKKEALAALKTQASKAKGRYAAMERL